MAVVGMSNLLEAGVHFGHQTKRWNPKMKEYIYSTRDDIYIMDLQKTVDALEKSYEVLKNIVSEGGKILFVGTKKQAQEVCREEAESIVLLSTSTSKEQPSNLGVMIVGFEPKYLRASA